MCGLVGIASKNLSASLLLDALRRLEYRGYDSAGVAVVPAGHENLYIKRVASDISALHKSVAQDSLPKDGVHVGIAHTRWATHGGVTVENAHPQSNGHIAVVHNGIIENFAELKALLRGTQFTSQTDTEVIVHLISQKTAKSIDFFEAVRQTTLELRGTFAIAVINLSAPDTMIVAKRGSPLVIGLGKEQFAGDVFVASDSFAIANYIDSCAELENDEICVIKGNKASGSYECRFFDRLGKKIDKGFEKFRSVSVFCEKGHFSDFTSKEISEQPGIISNMLAAFKEGRFVNTISAALSGIDRVNFIACGSSFYAGLVGKYLLEKYCKIQVAAEIASEFRYRSPVLAPKTLNIFVSQSGETLDTLCAQSYVKQHGLKTFVITNGPQSCMAKAADFLFDLGAGPELSVVSTKAFTAQLIAIICIMMELLRQKGEDISAFLRDLEQVPALINDVVRHFEQVVQNPIGTPPSSPSSPPPSPLSFIQILNEAKNVLFIGRNLGYPIAMESALKFKEISYVHAEGYPAGELKHGPIALVDESVVTVVVAPHDELIEKMLSNIQEIMARKGIVVLITDTDGAKLAESQNLTGMQLVICLIPKTGVLSKIFVCSVVGQLIAYNVAKLKDRNVDRPRNLAKSVTVE
ncbi:MAG: glutamine--fructose-6-phosphate transaminase (isomerizing) [Holosporales bacterium]|nr:glutamine--fructose-6-phosphate transaminase (isomerizing) [Holosporales bacterium]